MKKLLIAGAMSLALATGGCQTTGSNPPSLNLAALIQDAQVACELGCAIAPTALTIAAILTANPAIATANQISSIICAKVASTTQPKASTKRAFARKGVLDYGTIVINGKTIRIEGTPVQ